MKVLITGASGRLGSLVVTALLDDDWKVVSLTRTHSNSPEKVKEIIVDFDRSNELESVFIQEHPDVVIHLAGITGSECDKNPELAHKVNVDLTKRLAYLASQYHVACFVFVSSAAIYNQTRLQPTDEYSNIEPLSIYGKTKLIAERAIEAVAQRSDTQFFILRVFNIYGPGFNLSLVNRLLASQKKEPVRLVGYSNFYRDYIHVTDVARAISLCITIAPKKTSTYTVYNIASGKTLSNEQAVHLIESYGKDIYYNVMGDRTSYSWADISKARSEIGFTPKDSLTIE